VISQDSKKLNEHTPMPQPEHKGHEMHCFSQLLVRRVRVRYGGIVRGRSEAGAVRDKMSEIEGAWIRGRGG
jgi:hypothetical protein